MSTLGDNALDRRRNRRTVSGAAGWLDSRIDLLSTLLLTLATIVTAWCAFQSSVFSGQQGLRLSEAATANREAARLDLEADQLMSLDIEIFMSYMNARAEQRLELAEFYRRRFPKQLHIAFEDWMKTEPLTDPNAPPHPFVLDSYRHPYHDKAVEQRRIADERRRSAEAVNHYSDMYTLSAVMLATTLFFAGMAPKPKRRSARLILLMVATVELGVVIAMIIGLPLAAL